MAWIGQIAHADFVQREAGAAAQLALELQAQTRILNRIEQLLLDLRSERKFHPDPARGRILENFRICDQRGDAPLPARLLAGGASAPFDLNRNHPAQVLFDESGVVGIKRRVGDDVR